MQRTVSLLCVIAATAVACTPVYENRYSYDEGWRVATVTEVGRGDAIRTPANRDCRTELQVEVARSRVFARVTYSQAGHVRSMVVLVGEGEAPEPGMAALVNAFDCDRSLRPGP